MDEAAKAIRRTQIQNELRRIRHSRDDNTSARNRLSNEIDDLQSTRHNLENYIGHMINVEGKLNQCQHTASPTDFSGGRRRRVESRISSTCNNVKNEVQRHNTNLERINRRISDSRTKLENLIATISRQSNRINELERELRNL